MFNPKQLHKYVSDKIFGYFMPIFDRRGTSFITPVTGVFGLLCGADLAKKWTLTAVNCVNYSPVLEAQECASGVLSSPVCAVYHTDNPLLQDMKMEVRFYNTTVNYVCRENVEGIFCINRVSLP